VGKEDELNDHLVLPSATLLNGLEPSREALRSSDSSGKTDDGGGVHEENLLPHTGSLLGDGVNLVDDDTADTGRPDLGERRVEEHLGEDLGNGDEDLTVLGAEEGEWSGRKGEGISSETYLLTR
jgi:hypothetical protein